MLAEPREAHWQIWRGMLAKIERCAGKERTVSQDYSTSCWIPQYLMFFKEVAFLIVFTKQQQLKNV